MYNKKLYVKIYTLIFESLTFDTSTHNIENFVLQHLDFLTKNSRDCSQVVDPVESLWILPLIVHLNV